jgi:hypothetical protein
MKKTVELIVMLFVSLFLISGLAFAQNNQQNNSQSDQNVNKQSTTQADSNYHNSMAYYKYAEKNIISDKSKDEAYKGKFHNQNNMGESNSNMNNSNMNNSNMSNSHMNNMNSNMMGDSTQHHKMKSKWDSTKSSTKMHNRTYKHKKMKTDTSKSSSY